MSIIFTLIISACFAFALYRLVVEAVKTKNYRNLILFIGMGILVLATILIIRYAL